MIKTLNDDILYNYIIFLLHGNQASILSLGFKSHSIKFFNCILFLPMKIWFIFFFRTCSVVFIISRNHEMITIRIFLKFYHFLHFQKCKNSCFEGDGWLCKSLVAQAWRPELSF